MTTFCALCRNSEQDLFRGHIESVAEHGEAGNMLFRDRARGGIKQIQPIVREETVVECDAEQAVLDLSLNVDVAGHDDRRGLWFPDLYVPAAFDVEDSAIGGDAQLERISGTAIQDHLLIVRIDR